MTMPQGTPRVLHIHGSLATSDPQAARCVRLIGAFGGRLRHFLVAGDGDFTATDGVSRGIPVQPAAGFPPLFGLPLPGRLQRLARAMLDYHLVLTYGWGAIDAALAHTLFSEHYRLPPLIHHEDGSDETASERRGWRRKWYRRVGLGKAAGLVVPTETMEAVALNEWQQPLGRVKLIRDGVDLKRFARRAKPDAIPRLLKRPGENWIGCFAGSVDHGETRSLMGVLGALDDHWRLIVIGRDRPADGIPLALEHRVHFAPSLPDRAAAMALFDIVSMGMPREPLPLPAIEAMAAGKPVLGLDAAETAASLAPETAAIDDEPLARLAGDSFLRRHIGTANREKARTERDETAMIAAYRRLYASAMGRAAI